MGEPARRYLTMSAQNDEASLPCPPPVSIIAMTGICLPS